MNDDLTKAARDLTEIINLTQDLHHHATNQPNATIDGTSLPGGLAMITLAPVASIEAWEHRYETDERLGRDTSYVEDEDDTWEPPLQTLRYWTDRYRVIHNSDWDHIPTIHTEANFLRHLLNWCWDHETHWDHLTADIRKTRVRLEDVVHAGKRVERSRIVCSECPEQPRLIVIRGSAPDCSDDQWKCPSCKHRYDSDGVARAHAKMLRSEGAEKWLPQVDAIGTLKAQGRPERTVRQWLSDGEGSAYCDPVTHQVWVWWPDLWRRHLSTPTRSRGPKTVA